MFEAKGGHGRTLRTRRRIEDTRLSGVDPINAPNVARGSQRVTQEKSHLVQYKAKHGDCDVPQSEKGLGQWVKHQRTVYKANTLAQDRVDRLESIGFKWRKRDPVVPVPWETRFEELVQYKAKHGNCDVPKRQGELGQWVATQRAAYMANSIAQDRVNRLDSIGFKWAIRKPGSITPWETRFDELDKYKAKHGDCNVPARQGKLGRWVSNQ